MASTDDDEGEFIEGWPSRSRLKHAASLDTEGRIIGARMPVSGLEGLITPTDASYIVVQLGAPDPVFPQDYELEVTGLVASPTRFKLTDIRKIPGNSVRAVIECAGNDADFFEYLKTGKDKPVYFPEADAPDWKEAVANDSSAVVPETCFVSSGEWTGVSLREVLQRVGTSPKAAAVRLRGFDTGKPDAAIVHNSARRFDFPVAEPGVINYEKALPIEKAMDPDTILAWAHNGEYLRHIHGAPLRLVVPGWSGNWWVKWIESIELIDHMPELYYQNEYFVHGKSYTDPNKRPVMALGCKSIIIEPQDSETPLPNDSHVIRGLSWSGKGRIERVEVSTDSGQTWHDAHVERHGDRWLWRRWSYLWKPEKPGRYRILARATDETGRVQPATEDNFQRKHFDGIVPVDIVIA